MPQAKCHDILIVEDDESIRDCLAEVLDDEGYSVTVASNGREGLDRLRSPKGGRPPCVILLDLMMPVMDGFEFRAEQLKDRALAGIPVVVLSADGRAKVKAAALGIAEALIKPVDLDEVLAVVTRHCGSR